MRLNRDISAIKNRKTEADTAIIADVKAILDDVRKNGDEALRRYAEKFDGYTGADLLVTQEEISDALKSIDADFMRLLKRAALRITDFHKNQIEK